MKKKKKRKLQLLIDLKHPSDRQDINDTLNSQKFSKKVKGEEVKTELMGSFTLTIHSVLHQERLLESILLSNLL